DNGRFAVKRIAGEAVDVWADIFREGHALLAADLVWKAEGHNLWQHVPMRLDANDRWTATFVPPTPGRYQYAIEAWTDVFGTWRHDLSIKRKAGLDVSLELEEGRQLFADLPAPPLASSLPAGAQPSPDARPSRARAMEDLLLSNDIATRARKALQTDLTRSQVFPLYADRPLARAGAWYELVPRSQSRVPGRHGTFDDCIARLPELSDLGFDVVYLTPIHPIGRVNRKGR